MLNHVRATLTPQLLVTFACEFIAFNALFVWFHRIEILDEGGSLDLAPLANLFYAFFFVFDNIVVQFSLWSFGLYLQDHDLSARKRFRYVAGAVLFSMLVILPVYWLFGFVEDLPLRFPLHQPVFACLGFGILLGIDRVLLFRSSEDPGLLVPSKG